jgi:hypothetical protein
MKALTGTSVVYAVSLRPLPHKEELLKRRRRR